MTPHAVEAVVRDRFGLDPAALGPSVLPRAVEARTRACGLPSAERYAAHLAANPAEREALASELVVAEGWFFRGGVALFDRLAAFVASRAARSPGTAVRVLSVPCGGGEEPYSLTIALRERLVAPGDCAIDAADLSGRNLARAAGARYSAFSFREAGPDIRPAYFRALGDAWELYPPFRAGVRFLPGNLTDPRFLEFERPYDLIVCRNLFIYLTPDARQRAMANLDRLLALDGRLCLTPGEADRLPPGRFVPDGTNELGLYRRAGVGSALHTPLAAGQPDTTTPAPATPTPATLDDARRLADSGRLAEAQAACEKLLRADSRNADALALLGVIHLAAGRTAEANAALRKALYLVPDHAEALAHMAVLCERRGNAAQATALRARLVRTRKEDG
jgi:chemotaxis protein methyltransferase WspC